MADQAHKIRSPELSRARRTGYPALISFERTVGAIADAMIRQFTASAETAERAEKVSVFLLMTHAKMPDYLRLAFHMLTLLFDAWPYLTKGKPFHRLDLSQRVAQIENWERSRLEFRRGLITFYKSFTIFGLYSELYGQDYGWGAQNERD